MWSLCGTTWSYHVKDGCHLPSAFHSNRMRVERVFPAIAWNTLARVTCSECDVFDMLWRQTEIRLSPRLYAMRHWACLQSTHHEQGQLCSSDFTTENGIHQKSSRYNHNNLTPWPQLIRPSKSFDEHSFTVCPQNQQVWNPPPKKVPAHR